MSNLNGTAPSQNMANANGASRALLSDEKIAEIVFKIIIYIIGVVGNLLVIFVILFLQEYKKITHWYVLQMAFADIIFLQNLPFKLGEDIYGRWIHADWLCSAQQTVTYLTYYASIMFLVIMAVDRYLAVCHSMSSFVQRVRQPKVAYLTAFITWIVAILMSIPVMMNSSLFGLMPNCNCRLQFPVNEHVYCVQSGFGKNSTTMAYCRQEVLPFVLVGRCVDPTASFGDLFPSSSGTPAFPFPPVGQPGRNTTSKTNTTVSATTVPSPNVTTVPTILSNQPGGINTLTTPPINIGLGGGNPFAGIDLGGGNPFAGIDLGSAFSGISIGLPRNGSSSTNTTNSTGNGFFIRPPSTADTGGKLVLPTECHYDVTRTGWKIFTIVNAVIMFLVPLLIISVCYGLIIRRLAASSVSSGSGKASTGKSDREKRKVTILCALLTILFTIFWLPFHSVHLAKLVGIQTSDKNFCVRLVTSMSMLVYLSSATNPYLYNFLGTFHKRMRQIRDSKRMQNILSVAGITRTTGASKATSSSDGTKDKSTGKNSAIPMTSMAT